MRTPTTSLPFLRAAVARLAAGAGALGAVAGAAHAQDGAAASPPGGATAFLQALGSSLGALGTGLKVEAAVLVAAAVGLGLCAFAVVLASVHLAERRRWRTTDARRAAELADARARLDRAETFLAADRQLFIAWDGPTGEGRIEGDAGVLDVVGAAPDGAGARGRGPRNPLAFGQWLPPAAAAALEAATTKLRAEGHAFTLSLTAVNGACLEAQGRAVGGAAVMRLRDVGGERQARREAEDAARRLRAEVEALHALLDAVPQPAWIRDGDGRLLWVNAVYARAVEARDGADAAARGLDLLSRSARAQIEDGTASKPGADAAGKGSREGAGREIGPRDAPEREAARAPARASAARHARVPTVIAGERRLLDIVVARTDSRLAAIGIDVSELEAVRSTLKREMDAHVRTLDQLPTAVAMFDGDQRLVFHNAAYRELWGLDERFLASRPTDGELLDRLRAERRLPEQSDYRQWKRGILDGYRVTGALSETHQDWWYLPNGKIVRVVVTPNPQGGATYLFDDVTEKHALESRVMTLSSVQGETLDALAEAVAVFGTDGRLALANQAMTKLWAITPETFAERPHVDEVMRACAALVPQNAGGFLDARFLEIRGAVAGLEDERETLRRRFERVDGRVVDATVTPLPDGATLLTFADVTASVGIERALTERNEALEKASQLRDDFLNLVSFELRSPLNYIIGFAHILAEGAAGPLNERQRDYVHHINASSRALYAIVSDILDLASVDGGTVSLEVGEVPVRATMEAASVGVADRVRERGLSLELQEGEGLDRFTGDAKRVRQVLFNLLSNAVKFSPEGGRVTLSAERTDELTGDDVLFRVRDEGPGIPDAVRARVFERFESAGADPSRRGIGLGLAIVKTFVTLHGGVVRLEEAETGTSIACVFPAGGPAPSAPRVAPDAARLARATEADGPSLALVPPSQPAADAAE